MTAPGGWAADLLGAEGIEADPPDDAAIRMLDVVAAVDHLRRGARPGLTVWDALAEALSWWAAEHHDPAGPDNRPVGLVDSLAGVLRLAPDDEACARALQQALRRWADTMAERFNAGHHWPDPHPRRSFPPLLIER